MSGENRKDRGRNVSVPDFRKETDREYQYSNRPYQREYLKGTEWDREERRDRTGSSKNTTQRKNSSKKAASTSSKKQQTAGLRKKRKKKVSEQVQRARKKQRVRTMRRVAFGVMCIAAILVGNILGRVNAQLNQVFEKKQSGVNLEEVTVDESQLDSDENIINILVVGADKRESWSESGRSDCVMIATIVKKHKCLKLTSLMRDMYIDIPNHGKSKFNSAYSYGGISLLYQTIAYNFDLKLDGYVLVDFGAFKKVINKIGGVDVELTEAEANYLIKAYKRGTVTKVVPGMQTLNGKQALAYVRIRQDAAADFGRTARQRTVMQAIFTKVKTKSYSQLLELAETVMPYVQTDLETDEIYGYLKDIIMMGTTTLEQKRIPVDNSYTSQRINNMAVLVPDLTVNKQELQNFIFDYIGEENQ